MTKPTDIDQLSNEFGIEPSKATELLANLPQVKEERKVLEAQYNEIIRMDIENPETAKKAKQLRTLIRDNRTKGIMVWHKNTKEIFLRGGQFVDAIKRKEVEINEKMEGDLEQIEKHQEIKEAKRIEELRNQRIALIEPYKEFVPFGVDLGALSEEDFVKAMNGAKLQHEAKIEADRKAEEDRLAAEKAAEEERIRLKKENDRLKFIAEAKEKEQAKEREAAEAKLREEREAKEKLEAELKAKADAEEADRKAKELAEKKAKAAPDKEKIKAYLVAIWAIEAPEVSSPEAIAVLNDIKTMLGKIDNYVAGKLETI
jgi:hypothetical protein